MKRRFRLFLMFIGLWLVGHVLWIAIDGLGAHPSRPADVAVVLGNAVRADGTLAPRTEARCQRAVELYRAGLVKAVLTSGGHDAAVGRDEAATMRDYLVAQGVAPGDVFADSLGVDSGATARNTAALARNHGWRSVVVVSQWFHLTRCRLAFAKHAPDLEVQVAAARHHEWREIYSTLREVPAFYVYLLR